VSTRRRFLDIAHFERPNDPFVWSIWTWRETITRWKQEGDPVNFEGKQFNEFHLGYQDQREHMIPNAATVGMADDGGEPFGPPLDPFFEEEVLEEDERYIVKRAKDGGVVKVLKNDPESMPMWLDFPIKTLGDWEEYKKRLDPFSPNRFPAGWDIISEDTTSFPVKRELRGKRFTERDFAAGVMCATLYGGPRYHMGVEGLSYAIYDDIKLVAAMIEHQVYLSCEVLKQIFDAGITPDYAVIFEDMCYNHGPLVSPRFVREHMVPGYRKITDLLRSNGVDVIIVDTDGNFEKLIPIWLDCGINGNYPFEIAANIDPVKLRRQYKDLIIVGGIDKRALAKGKSEIDGEIEKARILLREGGYFPCVDHGIPPDVPYENFCYFINELRKLSDHEETRRLIPQGEENAVPGVQ